MVSPTNCGSSDGASPLCERTTDIPLLVHSFLKRYNERYRFETKLIDSGLKAMSEYSWPGNVRQLQAMVERLTILAPGSRIDGPAVRSAIEQMDTRESSSETLADTEARADSPGFSGDQRKQEPRREDSGNWSGRRCTGSSKRWGCRDSATKPPEYCTAAC